MTSSVLRVLGLAAACLPCGLAAAGPMAPASAAPPPLPVRLLLLAVDGAEAGVLDPMMARGDLPNLARLRDAGVWTRIESAVPTLSPVLWTSVATGKKPEKHGIVHFVETGPSGDVVPMTSNQRRAKALWNLLGDAGHPVAVVGWWMTWPAEPVNGQVVASYAGLDGRTYKGGFRPRVPRATFPEALVAELELPLGAATAEGERVAGRVFAGYDPQAVNPVQREVVLDSREVIATDAVFHRAAIHLARTRRPAFLAVYLSGLDVLGHRFWKYRDPGAVTPGFRVSEKEKAMFAEVVDRYAREVDRMLGELVLALAPSHTLVVSDHGFHADRIAGKDEDRVSGHHRDAPPGVLGLAGPGVRRAAPAVTSSSPEAPAVTLYDVAPTVLYLFGLGRGADMDGRVAASLLEPERLRALPPADRASYEDDPVATAAGAAAATTRPVASTIDEELEERLRSLGYLQDKD